MYFNDAVWSLLSYSGAATGGDLKYYVSTTILENFEGIEFSAAYSAIDPGTYYVYYMVDGGVNYVGVAPSLEKKVTATIAESYLGYMYANEGTVPVKEQHGYFPAFAPSINMPDAEDLADMGWVYEGHVALGFNTKADGTGTPYALGAAIPMADVVTISAADPDGIVRIYVHWGSNSVTHTVTYNVNGGSAAAPVQPDVAEGGAFVVAAYDGTKTGYLFGGWNDGTSIYAAGADYVMDTSNVTFTAVWNPISYIIAFSANGGTGEMANLNVVYDTEITLTANAFTRADNAFEGWAISATGTAVYGDAAKVVNLTAENGATVTLYVVWIQVQKSETSAVVNVTSDFVSDQAADQLVNAAKEMKDAGTQNVTVDVNATATDSVTIKSDSVKEAVDAGIGVNIATKSGTMEFSSSALKDKIAAGTTLKSEIKSVAIPAAYADKVPADTKVFSVTLTAGDTAITQFGGVFTVKIAYQATGSTGDLYVAYLAADGTLQRMDSYYEDGFMVFTTDHLSDYAVLTDSGNGGGNTLVIVIAIVVVILVAAGVAGFVFIKKKKA